jgi:hypothetical protein
MTPLIVSLVLHSPAAADVLVLKDGKVIEGDLVDNGSSWDVATKYGTLTIAKSDVRRVVKSAEDMAREAEAVRAKSKPLYEEALAIDAPAARNAKLDEALKLLEDAQRIYNEARDIFAGDAYAFLDRGLSTVIQEMRLYRERKVVEKPVEAAKPVPEPSGSPAEPAPAPSSAAAPVAGKSADDVAFDAPLPPADMPKPGDAQPATVLPPAAPKAHKPVAVLVEELKSTDIRIRREAVKKLSEQKSPEVAAALGEVMVREPDRELVWEIKSCIVAYEPGIAFKALRRAGEEGELVQKRAALAGIKDIGGEEPVKWAIDVFLLKSAEVPLLPEVTSALKKHRKISVPEMVRQIAKVKEPPIQANLIKALGVIGDPAAAPVLVRLLTDAMFLQNAVAALRKIGRPSIPELIRGLGGTADMRRWCGYLLREMTGQVWTSTNAAEWGRWWAENQSAVRAQTQAKDKQDADRNWPVTWEDFRGYEKLASLDPGEGPGEVPQPPRGSFRGGGFRPGAGRK